MRTLIQLALFLVVGVAVAIGTYFVGVRFIHAAPSDEPAPGTTPEADAGPKVQVTVVHVEQKSLSTSRTVYGKTAVAETAARTLSVPLEVKVVSIDVRPGVAVKAGQALLQIEPSRDAQAELTRLEFASKTAAESLKLAKERRELKLSTVQELATAEQTAAQADLELKQQRERLESVGTTVAAPADGVVDGVPVQFDQVVAANTALLQMHSGAPQVVLDIPTDWIGDIAVGSSLQLTSNLHAATTQPAGLVVSQIEPTVQADTNTIRVWCSPSGNDETPMPVGLAVTCELKRDITETKNAIPADAIVRDDDGDHVFVVREGHAVEISGSAVAREEEWVAFQSDDLKADDVVVTVGKSELEDGTAVETEIETPTTKPAADEADGKEGGAAR